MCIRDSLNGQLDGVVHLGGQHHIGGINFGQCIVHGLVLLLSLIHISGGFAKNPELLKKYNPDYADFFFNCASSMTGEGIQMGIDLSLIHI